MPAEHPEPQLTDADSNHGHGARSRVLAEGAHFATYVIEGLLGSGGMARVYRARHQTLGQAVALEVFESFVAPGRADIARFLGEAQVAAAIRHPHLVRTFDAGVHEGLPFLVMELLEGRDLESQLRSERVVEELALIELAIPIVAALMALHAQGVVHGDLGPGSIFLVATPQGPDLPKLLDVGISKPHQGLRLKASVRQRSMAAPLYLAPEALLGHELTPASDQYALGMLLYECVTGVNPFVSNSLDESRRLILRGERLAVLEQSVAPSPGLASVIERASSVAPEERFADLGSMGRALLRLADLRTRATWEFSFQPDPRPPAAGSERRGARTSGSSARWKAAGVALAVLGWATAGVVALQAAQHESSDQYVLLGARPTQPDEPRERRFELRPASALPLAAAPCAVVTGSSAEPAANGGEHALAPSQVPAQLPAEPEPPAKADPSGASPPLEDATEPSPHGLTSRVTPRGTNNAPIFE